MRLIASGSSKQTFFLAHSEIEMDARTYERDIPQSRTIAPAHGTQPNRRMKLSNAGGTIE